MFFAAIATEVVADKLVLKNGNELEGRILSEQDGVVVFQSGSAELRFPISSIERLERGLPTQYLLEQAQVALARGEDLLGREEYARARAILEEALTQLDEAMEEVPQGADIPAQLLEAQARLQQARGRAVPPDPTSRQAEALFQEALRQLDFVDYQDAFATLQEAAELAPDRLDIQVELAETAARIGRAQEALQAYGIIVRTEPAAYYNRVSQPYLQLLHEQGRRLLNDRRASEAIEIYEQVLLLQGTEEGKAVDVSQFLARRASQAEKGQEEVLMEVYRYADDRDLVDLAFAAVSRLERVDSDNPDVKRMVREARFLVEFKGAIDAGDTHAAAGVLAANPDLAEMPRLAERVERLTGGLSTSLEAERLLEMARDAFEASRYDAAATHAREIMTKYPEEEAVGEASVLLTKAEFERDIKGGLDEATALVEAARDGDASDRVAELLEMEDVDQSRHFAEIQRLEARIPRERRADELWILAKADLDEERYEEALVRLDELAGDFSETRAGRRAASWLRDYRSRLVRESEKYQPKLTDFFTALADPNLWRAAEYQPAPGAGRLQVAPVAQEFRSNAQQSFRALMADDKASRPQQRSFLMYAALPLGLGVLLCFGLIWRFARPGRGRFVIPSQKDGPAHTDHDPDHHCRACGQRLPDRALACPACGQATVLSDEEEVRKTDVKRRADYDPWKIRTKGENLNEFERHFQKAKDLAQTSDVQAAIDACRLALHEDPHRVDGYTLLADLYERVGARDEAAICYREIILLEPGEALARQKMKSVQAPAEIHPGRLPLVLAAALWWLIYFLVIGADPTWWHLRLGLCLLGLGLTAYLLKRLHATTRMTIAAAPHHDIDIHRPLPEEPLSWKEQNKQARLLADVIREHTGIEVPALTTWRLVAAVMLSVLLLLGMGWLAHLTGNWWLFAGWPAGAFLFVYLLEIHPRVLTAHILLRHFMEETLSPWTDPHMPFKPKGTAKEPVGEFLLEDPGHLPLRWALQPHPYPPNRQGLLNSLQHTLNRHWAFHRFYGGARIVKDTEMPMPGGLGLMNVFSIGAVVVALGLALSIAQQRQSALARYDESMQIGYNYLLEGDILRAREYFFEAIQLDRGRAAPHLYMAHSLAAAEMAHGAERSFRAAISNGNDLPQAHNDYANFLQRQGRLRDAVTQYEAALRFDPRNADILSNCGSALFKLQDHAQAVTYLRRATEMDAKHTRAYTTLGLALEALGDRDAAREAYETAVRVAPELAYTNVARDRLERDLAPEDPEPLRLENIAAAEVPQEDGPAS